MMRILGTRPRIVLTLVAAGLLAGLVWVLWAPPRGEAWVIGHHSELGARVATLVPLEHENWIAADGRFVILMALIGVAAAVLTWWVTPLRGALTVTVLALATLLSSVVAGIVGFALGGGAITGKTGHLITTRLTVHATGFYFVQTTICLFIYGLCVAFAREDDLGVGDPVSDEVVPEPLIGAES
jgi:hypothetical protein